MTNKKMKFSFKQNKDPRKPIFILLIASLIFASIYIIFGDKVNEMSFSKIETVSISQIKTRYDSGEITEIEIGDSKVKAKTKDGKTLTALKLPSETTKDLGFDNQGINKNTKVTASDINSGKFWTDLILSIIPIILIFMILSFILRQSTKGLGGGFSFGKSKAKMFSKENVNTKFGDVAGSVESKQELTEVVDFLKNPKKYKDIGAKIPKGVLLIGSPGTGKTLLAKAVAGESDVPFFGISGSEFVEMFVGVGASRVRDLFQKAKESAPSIIFIDEIDAIGKQRGYGVGGGHDEREQTLNQILTEMDGFDTDENVIIIAATNRPEVLDKALLRPGRFDRQVVINKPDLKERLEILQVHAKGKKIEENISLEEIAKKTPGFTGADLSNTMNEAAILAARENKKKIEQKHISEAVEKVMMGPERKSNGLNEKEKLITSYHEIGHALVSYFLDTDEKVHKISIIPRGMSLGSTWYLPKEEYRLYTETKFLGELSSLYGGHIAEKVKFGEVSTGASNDIERATKIARAMVTQYGMSSLGAIQWESREGGIYTGGESQNSKNHSEELAKKIDEEVMKILNNAFKKAEEIITTHKDAFEELAKILYDKETIFADEFNNFLEKKYGKNV